MGFGDREFGATRFGATSVWGWEGRVRGHVGFGDTRVLGHRGLGTGSLGRLGFEDGGFGDDTKFGDRGFEDTGL